MPMTRILITGAAGFIGYHLCKLLQSSDAEVIGIDNLNDYYDPEMKRARLQDLGVPTDQISPDKLVEGHGNFRFQQLDLQEKDGLEALFTAIQPAVVVHLAAQVGVRYSIDNPGRYVSSNLVGFCNLLEACRHHSIQHFVFASSSSVYGLNRDTPYSEARSADHPISLYAATKRSNELLAHSYAHLYQLPVTGLRFFTVYGPWNRPDMAAFLFTKAIYEQKPIQLFNRGEMLRDFTYVEDVAQGISVVIQQPPGQNPNFDPTRPQPNISSAPFRIFNIGNGKPVKLLDFVRVLESSIGKNATLELVPYQPGDMQATSADCSELEQILGFRPTTSLKVGLDNLVSWYQTHYSIPSV